MSIYKASQTRATHLKGGKSSMENRDISQMLYEQNQEYRSLFDEHRSLESRLVELSSHRYLSDTEQIEEVTLKKKKLALKDKMQELLRRFNS